MSETYPRDLIGYGGNPPDPRWPNGARIAVSVVINYEEGGEYSILHGDPHSETVLTDMRDPPLLMGARNLNVESIFEYGSRVGFWSILSVLKERSIPATIYAVGMALERNPTAARAMRDAGCEIASHGYRWIDYQNMRMEEERTQLRQAVAAIERLTGSRPLGWYTGRPSPNTRRLVVEDGGFLYDSDAYNDDLPYWTTVDGKAHLVVPYSFDNNDSRSSRGQGFETGEVFFTYLRDSFDWLYSRPTPRMMSIGLHCRLTGRPGRLGALCRVLDYMGQHKDVWFCRRVDIARHWRAIHPHRGDGAA
ncbi:MAG: allantoinase PuuE [Proteobacteria bacterium]|nr:allantoinase PuuE [Pseudomonadota bacterium]MBI3497472.1 allantoinase PuuE [Pseudomonadota bacterium]